MHNLVVADPKCFTYMYTWCAMYIYQYSSYKWLTSCYAWSNSISLLLFKGIMLLRWMCRTCGVLFKPRGLVCAHAYYWAIFCYDDLFCRAVTSSVTLPIQPFPIPLGNLKLFTINVSQKLHIMPSYITQPWNNYMGMSHRYTPEIPDHLYCTM